MMVVRAIYSKRGRVELEPSFHPIPTFFVPANPQHLQEGEFWVAEPIGEPKPIGKKDKRGRDKYIQKVLLKERYITDEKSVFENGRWIIYRYSGNVLARTETSDGEEDVSIQFTSRTVYLKNYLVKVKNGQKIITNSKETASVSFEEILKGETPSWVPQDVVTQVRDWENKIIENRKKEKEKAKRIEFERTSILQRGGGLPSDLLRAFVLHGVKIVWRHPDAYVPDPRLPFYGEEDSLFQVGDFVFGLGIEELDEDSIVYAESFPTSAGSISYEESKKLMKKIAFFASSPRKKLSGIIGIEKPENKYILNEREWLSGYTYSLDKYRSSGSVSEEKKKEILSALKEKAESINYQPKLKEFRFQDLIYIRWESELQIESGIRTDVEEGIGAKDGTTHVIEYAYARAYEKWHVEVAEISDAVATQIADCVLKEI